MRYPFDKIFSKKIVMWDFDGCFCDSEPIHYEAYAKAFAAQGHLLNKEEYFATFTHTGGGVDKEIENHKLNCDGEKVKKDKAAYYWELISKGKALLFPEIPQIINLLNKLNIRSVIASNSPKKEIEIILSFSKETVAIDEIFGIEPGLRKKPFPDIFINALNKLNIEPKNALVIEDSERGLSAAQSANCEALWIKTYLTEKFSSQAPYLAKLTHAELLQALTSSPS